mgnify:CR=1 FL=1
MAAQNVRMRLPRGCSSEKGNVMTQSFALSRKKKAAVALASVIAAVGLAPAAALAGPFGEACSVPAAVECAEVVPGAAPWGWVGRQAVAVTAASPAIMRSRIDRAGFTVVSFRS